MKYDYEKNIREDIKSYIKSRYDSIEEINDEELYDEMFVSDCVTGNASGSYTCNSYLAKEYVYNNEDLLKAAIKEFCVSGDEVIEHLDDYEWQDVMIRLYWLPFEIQNAIKELESEGF